MEALTPAERRVLPYIVAGLDYSAAAAALCLAPVTVKNHRREIEDKLGVDFRQLAAYALIRGHVDADDVLRIWRQHMPGIVEIP